MSIELPGWVADAFNLVGLPWPGIDEDQLRAWASGVRGYASEITALSTGSRSAVAALAASNDSSFARTLAAQWEHHHQLISDLRGPMEVFAGALDVAADAVVAQKVVVIGAAVVLAGEVIATQAEALFTFGAAEAEVPAEVAIARLAVKAALQELEGQLLGMLINKAAAEISAVAGGTIGKLVSGGGQVAAEAVTLTADYHAMTTLSAALSGHAVKVEQASSLSWRRAGSGSLEEGGPGGGWREVARAVEQAVLQVLRQLFVDLGRALWKIITDTIAFLKKAITALRRTDDTLAVDARKVSRDATDSTPSADAALQPLGAKPPPSFGDMQRNAEINETLDKVNPKFDASKPAYSENCSGVVQANELRRRGLDVQAGPLEKHLWSTEPNGAGGRPLAAIEGPWGRQFTPGTRAEIEQAFKEPGSRGVVAIRWPDDSGHLFNVENVGGKVRFLDGQPTPPLTDVSHYFDEGHSTAYVRLDDLPTPPESATKPYLEP